MFTATAEYYDLIYSALKDYDAETAQIANLLRRLNPTCRTVLDVACGTGEHARLLAGAGFGVDGLDLDPAFVRIASGKHPAGRFIEADMTDFQIQRRYEITDATGTRHAKETHELGLFTPAELLQTFQAAGLRAECDPKGLTDRGLYVARVA